MDYRPEKSLLDFGTDSEHFLDAVSLFHFFELNTHRGTHDHPIKLFYPDPRVSVRAHCFPIRVIVLRNRLPASVVLAENIQMSRKLLKHVNFSHFHAVLGKA